jgi:hypothetical protein
LGFEARRSEIVSISLSSSREIGACGILFSVGKLGAHYLRKLTAYDVSLNIQAARVTFMLSIGSELHCNGDARDLRDKRWGESFLSETRVGVGFQSKSQLYYIPILDFISESAVKIERHRIDAGQQSGAKRLRRHSDVRAG